MFYIDDSISLFLGDRRANLQSNTVKNAWKSDDTFKFHRDNNINIKYHSRDMNGYYLLSFNFNAGELVKWFLKE